MKNEVAVTTDQINAVVAIAKYAANSKLFDKLLGSSDPATKEAAAFCIAMYAHDLGLPIMPCLFGGIRPVVGNIEISPRMMNGMIRKAGHKIDILKSDEAICTLKGTRHDTKESYTCSFTIDDARRAGLVRSGGGYEKWASDMLFARCLSRLSRRLFADVISTAYIEGEISLADAWVIEPAGTSEILIEATKPEPQAEVIQIDGFLAALAKATSVTCGAELMMEYLMNLEEERKVPVAKIMEQALRKELIDRFVKGFQNWCDAKTDAESIKP